MAELDTGVFFLPSIGSREQMEAGMAGRDRALYRRMLDDLAFLARTADDQGYDAIAFTEHHFHIEGFEISNNPVLLDLFVGLQTRRIRVGQLGIVLPASSPLRVAEDIAMLDQMTGGRAFAGFARGYQRRWVDVLAQPYHDVHAAPSGDPEARGAEVDRVNRAAFEEFFEIVRKAWTQETFSHQGQFWQIPPPGIPWAVESTRTMGRGVGEDGIVREIGVVPRPVQQPHPPIMQPFSFSEPTIRWCARNGVQPILAPVNDQLETFLFNVYHEEATAHGRQVAPGEGMGVLRDVMIAATDAEAWDLWRASGAFVGAAWFAPFGFGAAIPRPGEEGPLPPEEMHRRGLMWVGSPDTVRRQIKETLERLPLKYVMAWQYNGLVPRDAIARSMAYYQEIVASL